MTNNDVSVRLNKRSAVKRETRMVSNSMMNQPRERRKKINNNCETEVRTDASDRSFPLLSSAV